MKNINLKGVSRESVTGVLILLLALINAVLQMFGLNTLPIKNNDISVLISSVFVIGAALYNTWKNRNISSASQIAQNITDALKTGELLEDDVRALLDKIKK